MPRRRRRPHGLRQEHSHRSALPPRGGGGGEHLHRWGRRVQARAHDAPLAHVRAPAGSGPLLWRLALERRPVRAVLGRAGDGGCAPSGTPGADEGKRRAGRRGGGGGRESLGRDSGARLSRESARSALENLVHGRSNRVRRSRNRCIHPTLRPRGVCRRHNPHHRAPHLHHHRQRARACHVPRARRRVCARFGAARGGRRRGALSSDGGESRARDERIACRAGSPRCTSASGEVKASRGVYHEQQQHNCN
mmetsp:Transcript_13794/g.45372  ORF Transcript_13794/g.45372 Transcript_13794/m.45372 type:complete len:250 (-) Transcript_13794:2-751(-)